MQAAKVSIKVSPSGSFFPGTQERVLVIFGESMNIREVEMMGVGLEPEVSRRRYRI